MQASQPKPIPPAGNDKSPAYWYTLLAGAFLLLQGTSTLAFRLVPALDRAFPALLDVTRMIPPHSSLHILTAGLAFLALARRRQNGPFWFAFGFGAFYVILSLAGEWTGAGLGLGLQPFDHSFHLVLGALGLLAAWVTRRSISVSTKERVS